MAKAITGRITLNLVAGIVITVATVLITVSWMAHKHNEQAAQNTETMVVGGVQSMGRRMAALANDYGWWEEAYDAYVRGDGDWIDANMGTGITDTRIADLLFIISPAGDVDHKWLIDDAPDTLDQIITAARVKNIREIAARVPVENLAATSDIYIDTPSAPMMISIQHLVPVSKAATTKGTDLPIIVFGQYLQEPRMHELGAGFLINDLHFVRANAPPPGGSLVVPNLIGHPLGYLAWTPPKPGDALLRSVLLPIGTALGIFCVVAFATAFRARKIAIALTNSEKEAVTAARTDSMTCLMNRNGFNELIESRPYRAACREGHLAVVYLDVNGFKTVNDSIGHHGGDELVRAISDRIASVIPEGASLARIGGDEFAVVMLDGGIGSRAAGTAQAISRVIDKPFTVYGFEFHVTAAVGFAVAGDGGIDPSEVIRRADVAMYQSKRNAEREPVAYTAAMETGALEKKQIEAGLRQAIERGEFQVYYQPVARTSDLRISAVEALVRWTSRELGSISPAVFIPVAEETGLIHEIGRIVVHQACEDLHRWPDLMMAINVSPVQLRDPGFADEIHRIVVGHGHSPARFELELTEGILVNNPTIAERKLATLKGYGFSLSLDDFGTGFSSIGYLREFPFDILKIDRSFVRDIGMNATANTLIQSLVSLGGALNLTVIAEGIENDDQLKLLRLIQCEFVQGFMISKPVAAADIDLLVAGAAGGAAAVGEVRLAG
jgi:diguanylate cyclase (GGDEF)-like protein